MKSKKEKVISKRITPFCSVCGRKVNVICYRDRTYRGGHYFGKFPLYDKKELKKARQGGVQESVFHGRTISVLKKDPKPYGYAEYWECPRCYWKT
jgi:hypothetical protein